VVIQAEVGVALERGKLFLKTLEQHNGQALGPRHEGERVCRPGIWVLVAG
jgi:hypothetical protein